MKKLLVIYKELLVKWHQGTLLRYLADIRLLKYYLNCIFKYTRYNIVQGAYAIKNLLKKKKWDCVTPNFTISHFTPAFISKHRSQFSKFSALFLLWKWGVQTHLLQPRGSAYVCLLFTYLRLQHHLKYLTKPAPSVHFPEGLENQTSYHLLTKTPSFEDSYCDSYLQKQ